MTIFVRVFALPVPFLSLLLALSLTHERQHETKIYGGGRSGGEGGYRGRDGQGGKGQCGRRRQHAWCVLLLQIWQMCACIRGLIYLCMHMPPTHARPYTRTDTATQRHRDTETQRHRGTHICRHTQTQDTPTHTHMHTRTSHTQCSRARHTHKCANDACAFWQQRARTKKDRDDARAGARSEGRVVSREGRDTARNTGPFQHPQTQAHTYGQIIYPHSLT